MTIGALPLLVSALILVDVKEPDALQVDRTACGPLALQLVAKLNGLEVSSGAIANEIALEEGSCSLHDLDLAAQKMGLHTFSVNWREVLPADVSVPAIIPVTEKDGRPHFVVLVRMRGSEVQVLDFPRAPFWADVTALRSKAKWSGIALHISSDPQEIRDLERKYVSSPSSLRLAAFGGAILLGGFSLWQCFLQRLVYRRKAD